MPNELDMDTYHSQGIDPGEHKVFNISSDIHTFNEKLQPLGDTFDTRFQGQQNESFPQAPINKPEAMGWWKTETPQRYFRDVRRPPEASQRDLNWNPDNMPGGYESIQEPSTFPKFTPLFGEGDTLGDQFKDLMLKVADRPEDKDIQRIKIMPGLLSGPQAKGAKQFMSQEEAMANLAKGLRGRMREGWKPGPGSYRTREKPNIDTSVQIKPEKPVKQRQPEPGTVDPEYEKAVSDWMKNQEE